MVWWRIFFIGSLDSRTGSSNLCIHIDTSAIDGQQLNLDGRRFGRYRGRWSVKLTTDEPGDNKTNEETIRSTRWELHHAVLLSQLFVKLNWDNETTDLNRVTIRRGLIGPMSYCPFPLTPCIELTTTLSASLQCERAQIRVNCISLSQWRSQEFSMVGGGGLWKFTRISKHNA